MDIDAFLTRLAGVRTVGRGWIAQCPAHQDQTPSLSIHAGVDMILVHCFAGCTFEAICVALDLRPSQFFFRESLATSWDEVSKKVRSRWLDVSREANRGLVASTKIVPDRLSPEELAHTMDQVCDLRALLELADTHERAFLLAREAHELTQQRKPFRVRDDDTGGFTPDRPSA